MSATAKQVEGALNKWIESQPQHQVTNYRGNKEMVPFSFDWYGDETKKVELEGLGTLEFVTMTPDDPGDGKFFGSVWKLGDQYFCQGGYYSSWDSSEFDGSFNEVRPAEQKVTVWENVQ